MERTNRTRARWIAAIAFAAVAAGALIASNIGFQVTYGLDGPADSASGTNWLALPYKLRAELVNASDLFQDLGGAAVVTSIGRFDPQTDAVQVYAGDPQDDFALTPGEGLIISMKSTKDYKIYGSHDPGQAVTLVGPEASLTGTNQYSPPYHGQAATAAELLAELGANGVTVSRLLRDTDGIESYSGSVGDYDFPLVKGESYRIQVAQTIEFIPKTRY